MRMYFSLALIATALSVSSIAIADTNAWTSLGPDGGSVRAMAIDPQNSNTLYALTDAGVSKTIDGGKHWDLANSGLPAAPVGIVIDPKRSGTLYVVADVGIFKSTDAAASWTPINSGLPIYAFQNYSFLGALAISAQDPNTLYAGICCSAPAVFKSTDGGASWMPMGAGVIGNLTLLLPDPKNEGTVYAVTADYLHSIFKTTDGGVSWTALTVRPMQSYYFATLTIDSQDSKTLYATEGPPLTDIRADGALIRKSQDGGATWSSMNTAIPSYSGVANNWIDALAIDPQNSRNLYAGTLAGLYKSTDAAVTWSKVDTAPQGQIATLLLDAVNSGAAWAGTGNGVFKSTDGAASWVAASSGMRAPVMAVYPDPLNLEKLYALSRAGISKSTDAGANWTDAGSGIPPDAISVLAIDSQTDGTVYAAVFGSGEHTGGVFKSIDNGTSWQRTALPRGGGAESMAIDPQVPTTLYAWNSLGLYKTTDGSATWSTISPGNYNGVKSLVIDPQDSNIVYGCDWNGLVKSTDGGTTFSPADSGFPQGWYPRALAVAPQNSAILYAWNNLYDPTGPRLFKTTDAAATWKAADVGLEGNQISSLVIDPRNGDNLYAATGGFAASGLQVSALFASTDGGAHWNLLSPALPTQLMINKLALSAQDSTRLYAATSGGTFALAPAPRVSMTAGLEPAR